VPASRDFCERIGKQGQGRKGGTNMMGKRGLQALGLVIVASAPMAACSGDGGDDPTVTVELETRTPGSSTLGAANDHTVLILSTTVINGLNSREAIYAAMAGYTVEIATPTSWAAKTASDFATYRALILGDPDAGIASTTRVAAAIANRHVWGPVVNGNVILVGTDPVGHQGQGGNAVTQGAVQFAAAEPGTTGAYFCLSEYYDSTAVNTPVPLLEPFQSPATGAFTVRGVGCYNVAHKVADHVALNGVTDASISNWGCSVHEAFDHFPSDFLPLAIARGSLGAGTVSFPDGTSGIPYVMARGRTLVPVLCGDGVRQQPSEECDDGNTNNCDGCSAQCKLENPVCGNGQLDCGEDCDDGNTSSGDGCSSTCEREICGNGTLDPGEQCDDGNTTAGDGCSPTCQIDAQPPVARCADRTVIASNTCSADADVNDGSYDPDGNLVGCIQTPVGPYSGVGPHAVTLICTDTTNLSASCTATVTVVDQTPPALTCPDDVTLECTAGGAVATYAASATDNCSIVSPTCTPPSGSTFPVGNTTATCSAADESGNASSCAFSVTVTDTGAPVVTTQPLVYWPPNHKYKSFHLSDCVTSIVDACQGPLTLDDVNAQITRITSDELEDDKLAKNGLGDGDTCNDIVLTGPQTADLRVERSGGSNGRLYTVSFEVTDANGNVTTSSCEVGVPHDQSPSSTIVDDGCNYCVGAGCGTCPGHDPVCTY
jgi:cysteine-rich repeat protein